MFDPRYAWGIVRDVANPNVALVLDSFHSLVAPQPALPPTDTARCK